MTSRVQIEGNAGPVNDLYVNIEKLKTAAEAGKVDDLYDVIQHEPGILESMDQVPFAHTPLHIAASEGQMDFAMEMMNLKSSFSRKLNPYGFTPLHLAVQNDHNLMVMWFLDVDSTLARFKGRGAKTPLHLAAERGNVDMLTEFFEACPESIKDVTIQGDTALHLAVKEKKEAAFKLLVAWLRRSVFPHAGFWEREILNWKNKEGNTALHIAAENDLFQVVEMLVEKGVYKHVKNSEEQTAMGILEARGRFSDTEIRNIERRKIVRLPMSREKRLDSSSSIYDKIWVLTERFASTFTSSETRSSVLVVDALIGTITYQAAMNPPGGVWQGSANINSTAGSIFRYDEASNPTASATEATASHYVGTTVMTTPIFSAFWVINTIFFLPAIIRLIAYGSHRTKFSPQPIFYFVACYLLAMSVISPSTVWSSLNLILLFFLALVFLLWNVSLIWGDVNFMIHEPKQERRRSRKGPDSREEWWQ